jgi:hypothetical protein
MDQNVFQQYFIKKQIAVLLRCLVMPADRMMDDWLLLMPAVYLKVTFNATDIGQPALYNPNTGISPSATLGTWTITGQIGLNYAVRVFIFGGLHTSLHTYVVTYIHTEIHP